MTQATDEKMATTVLGPAPRNRWRLWCRIVGHRWDERKDLLAHCQRCGEWGIRRQ